VSFKFKPKPTSEISIFPSSCHKTAVNAETHYKPSHVASSFTPKLDKGQQKITAWTHHRPFISGITPNPTAHPKQVQPSHPRQLLEDHLQPFGTPLPAIDKTKILRVCLQNTQHSINISGDGLELSYMMMNLAELNVSLYTPISPNVDWKNPSNWAKTCRFFRNTFQQVHLSAVSSDIGLGPIYINKSLVVGSAILTFSCGHLKYPNHSQMIAVWAPFPLPPFREKGIN
jgi:hypothetical protein